ncbi:hypothetical protein HH310_09165 [Actinoplanes sp. TBRC 11911]|uniref:hypothetical protein n=1 Tax=Actinoplanes sp. TBRC 11911 TaxID=2729386 RepID=UPI00145EA88A|nr:hypothetical protein [Actinoplanes sp. TBRC 11911]NMO51357.1 hypothetical protein [Actinoplanes sp. TBRC 11911]
MAYRVEYNGEDYELATLDAALQAARQAIADDIRRLDGWTVDHDDTINDWFVQAVLDGRRVGPTAVVYGPDPVAGGPVPRTRAAVYEEWERRVIFVGDTPAEAFALAADWLERRPGIEAIGDVGWHHTADGHQLRLYYRG